MIDWQRIWNDNGALGRFSPTGAILYLFSLLYRLIVHLRNRLYDRQILKTVKLPCPVISIGNITVGGTGKTPCVIALTRMLQEQGYEPAVLSRGYGGKRPKPVNVVSDGKNILLDVQSAGDEPLLIARSLPGVPVLTGAKRRRTGQAAIDQFGARVLICDDAYQHRQIFRDIDIVLLDAEKPLGNGQLLPRGPLREPVVNLSRAHCIILTRADNAPILHQDVARIASASRIPVFRAAHRFREMIRPGEDLHVQPGDLYGKRICAFCGIARPDSFKKLLENAGVKLLSFIPFPDHYAYTRHDLEALKNQFLPQSADYWVTTEKDAMRLADHPDFLKTIWILRMDMTIEASAPSFEAVVTERLTAAGRG